MIDDLEGGIKGALPGEEQEEAGGATGDSKKIITKLSKGC